MSRQSVFVAVALFAATLIAPRMAAADTAEVVPLWFKADITIAADGTVSELEWRRQDKMPAAIVARLQSAVAGWQFQPGTLDGQPAETETTLTVRLDAREVEEGIALTLASASTGATMSQEPPDYPRIALRRGVSAKLILEVTIEANGAVHVEMVDYVDSNSFSSHVRGEFAASAIAAVKQWDVRQERVGGHAVATRMRVPFDYCLAARDWCKSHPSPSAVDTTDHAAIPPGAPVALDSVAKLLTDLRDIEI